MPHVQSLCGQGRALLSVQDTLQVPELHLCYRNRPRVRDSGDSFTLRRSVPCKVTRLPSIIFRRVRPRGRIANDKECAPPGQDVLASRMADTSPPSFRVLSFVFHTSYSGRIAIDGFGLVRSSLCASRVGLQAPRSRRRALAQLLARSLRRFRPAVVVLGIAQDETSGSRALRLAAEHLLGTLTKVPIVRRSVRAGRLYPFT